MEKYEMMRLVAIGLIITSLFMIVFAVVLNSPIGTIVGVFGLAIATSYYILFSSANAKDSKGKISDDPYLAYAYFTGIICMYCFMTYFGHRWFQVDTGSIAAFPDSILAGIVSIIFGILLGWWLPKKSMDGNGLDVPMIISNNAPFIIFPIFLVYQPAASWIFAGMHLISSGVRTFSDSS